MQPKKDIATPGSAPAPGEQESGVQLSRNALYDQRIAEIAADRKAGRCTPDEAAERVVEANVALYGRFLTPEGRNALREYLRGEVLNDPELRKVFS